MQDECTLIVAKEFSICPIGRFKKHGSHSGEGLRELIVSKLATCQKLIIDFDGVVAGHSSALDEAFAGLIRKQIMTYEQIKDRIVLISTQKPNFITEIEQCLQEQQAKQA
jgi:hypothetical protein